MNARRWLGLLPVAFFAWTTALYFHQGTAPELLWICNVSNLTLGVAMLADLPVVSWISTLWILQGIGPWIIDSTSVSGFNVHAFFTHFGSAAVGIFALARQPLPRAPTWWKAALFFVGLQLVSRATTPASFNVNQVFGIHPSMQEYFSSFAAYYAANFAFYVSCIAATEHVLRKIFAARAAHAQP